MANKESKAMSGAASGAAAGTAIMPGWGTAIGGIVGGLGGLMGGDDSDPMADYKKYLASIPVPTEEELRINPETNEYLGDFTPEMLEALSLGPSSYENVSVDPRLKENQMGALDMLSQLAETGFGEEDLAAFELAQRKANSQAVSQRNATLQDRQQRGIAGGGDELAANLMGNEQAASRLSEANLQQSIAQAEARKQAINQLASQSTSVRAQDYDEQARLAEARDLVNQYNTKNQQNVKNANTSASNVAGQSNLSNRQAHADGVTGIRNQTAQYNAQIPMQIYNAKMGNASQMGQIAMQDSKNQRQDSANTGAALAQIGQGVAGAVSASKSTPAAPGSGENVANESAYDPNKYNFWQVK